MFLQELSESSERGHAGDLAAEAHHRIANSLSILSALMQREATGLDAGRQFSQSDVRRILDDVRARLDAVGRFHRMLSGAAAEGSLEVGGYLHQLASQLIASLASPDAVTLHFMCELGCRLPPTRALYLGLIVCELVTNSLKYAHPTGVHGDIRIVCRREPQGMAIEVSDDGIGLPENFDVHRKRGSGLELMRSMAQQIGATLAFEDGGLGFRCAIHVPTLEPV